MPAVAVAHGLVSWAEFRKLPECPETEKRYELHDGEVVTVPPERPLHSKLEKRIEHLLEGIATGRGVIVTEFPYRPLADFQYWFADIAYIPQHVWDALPRDEYPIYSPPVIIQVTSHPRSVAKLRRQRELAMAAGTQEFWIVDADARSVEVADASSARVYSGEDCFTTGVLAGNVAVRQIFAD